MEDAPVHRRETELRRLGGVIVVIAVVGYRSAVSRPAITCGVAGTALIDGWAPSTR